MDPGTVSLWRRRFLVHRVTGILSDAPRPGRRPRIPTALATKIQAARAMRHDANSARASSRDLARELGVSQSTVIRIWKHHRGTAHRPADSRDDGPPAGRTIRDVRGVYVSAIDRSVVLITHRGETMPSVDPKGPRPLSARPGGTAESPRTAARDPLAPVRVLYRTIVPAHRWSHRTNDFLLFLRGIDVQLSPGEEAHVLLRTDTLGKETTLLRWLRRHPAFHLYLAPIELDGAQLDFQVPEGLTVRGVREESLPSLPQLVDSFRAYSMTYRRNPRPFVWNASLPGRASPRPLAKPPIRASPAEPAPWLTAVATGHAPSADLGSPPVPPILPSTSMAFLPIRAGLSGGYAPRIEPLDPADRLPNFAAKPAGSDPISPKGIPIPDPLPRPEPYSATSLTPVLPPGLSNRVRRSESSQDASPSP